MRLVLKLAVQRGYFIRQADVSTAFLNAEMDGIKYIEHPTVPGSAPRTVCRLKRALYGLRSSPRLWEHTLARALMAMGFVRCPYDESLYVKYVPGGAVMMATYVDDLLLMGPDDSVLSSLLDDLGVKFKLKQMPGVTRYLGMNVSHDRENGILRLDQSDKIKELATSLGLCDTNPPKVPMEESTPTLGETGEALNARDTTRYRALVGSLMHVACYTRPDLSYATGMRGRLMSQPNVSAMKAGQRLAAYAFHTATRPLTIRRDDGEQMIRAFSDSDFAGSSGSKSTTGFVIFLGSTPVVWKSRRQTFVSQSTCKAEFIALTETAREAIWLAELFQSVVTNGKVSKGHPVDVYTDNQAAVLLAKGDGHKGRTKHITLRHDYLREKLRDDDIKISRVSTNHMPADGLTKPLQATKFQSFLEFLGLGERNV